MVVVASDGADICPICREGVDGDGGGRGAGAWGHTPCCRQLFHRQCLQRWLNQTDRDVRDVPTVDGADNLTKELEVACPCRRNERLVARALVAGRPEE